MNAFRSIYNFNLVLVSSSNFYAKMVKSLLRVPIVFFDTTPIGTVITRFAKDITVCDMMLGA